jgi:hypothetical protein
MNYTSIFLNRVINSHASEDVFVIYFTNIHQLSHMFDWFLACSSCVNIIELAVNCTILFQMTVSQYELLRIQTVTANSDSVSVFTFQL